MAQGKPQMSFQEYIDAERAKKRNQELAQRMLGSQSRRSSAPAAGASRNRNDRQDRQRSLINRVHNHGISRRPASINPRVNLNRQRSDPRLDRGKRLYGALLDRPGSIAQANVTDRRGQHEEGINIRGRGNRLTTVLASNFAPGTTAADIESVVGSVGGEMLSCELVAKSPTVIAELVFSERSGAENVVDIFNNKRADGRQLYVYIKDGPPQAYQPHRDDAPAALTPRRPKADSDEMDIDDARETRKRYDEQRSARRAEPRFEDGRFGFREGSSRGGGDNYNRRNDDRFEGRLESDQMLRGDRGGFRR